MLELAESERIELAKARHFPDTVVIEACYRTLPREKGPVFGTYCRDALDLALAQALAPCCGEVNFLLHDDLPMGRRCAGVITRAQADTIAEEIVEAVRSAVAEHGLDVPELSVPGRRSSVHKAIEDTVRNSYILAPELRGRTRRRRARAGDARGGKIRW
jgi:hypothetical protein